MILEWFSFLALIQTSVYSLLRASLSLISVDLFLFVQTCSTCSDSKKRLQHECVKCAVWHSDASTPPSVEPLSVSVCAVFNLWLCILQVLFSSAVSVQQSNHGGQRCEPQSRPSRVPTSCPPPESLQQHQGLFLLHSECSLCPVTIVLSSCGFLGVFNHLDQKILNSLNNKRDYFHQIKTKTSGLEIVTFICSLLCRKQIVSYLQIFASLCFPYVFIPMGVIHTEMTLSAHVDYSTCNYNRLNIYWSKKCWAE